MCSRPTSGGGGGSRGGGQAAQIPRSRPFLALLHAPPAQLTHVSGISAREQARPSRRRHQVTARMLLQVAGFGRQVPGATRNVNLWTICSRESACV